MCANISLVMTIILGLNKQNKIKLNLGVGIIQKDKSLYLRANKNNHDTKKINAACFRDSNGSFFL